MAAGRIKSLQDYRKVVLPYEDHPGEEEGMEAAEWDPGDDDLSEAESPDGVEAPDPDGVSHPRLVAQDVPRMDMVGLAALPAPAVAEAWDGHEALPAVVPAAEPGPRAEAPAADVGDL